jgi:formylglycine-generating enzyme required for sulfatase activity
MRLKNSLGMEFVWIEPGTFMMGSRWNERGSFLQEHHKHEVTLTRGYYLQTTPVTQGQWKAVMGDNPSGFKDKGPDYPVEKVSWNAVQIYIQILAELVKRECRLPTEAEWEYACRAGSQTAYSFGTGADELDQYAWFEGNSGGSTRPVGQLKPNPWGLYDMHGNVLEWCHDRYGEEYPHGPVTDPTGPDNRGNKNNRVIRGGGWRYKARICRSAFRVGIDPDDQSDAIGFRLVMPHNPRMTRIATRDDWQIHPMPDAHQSITIDRRYSTREFSRLAAGAIPKEMEDKWFIYYDEPWLHLHRSWTGYCFVQVRFELSGDDMVVAEAIVNRDQSQ